MRCSQRRAMASIHVARNRRKTTPAWYFDGAARRAGVLLAFTLAFSSLLGASNAAAQVDPSRSKQDSSEQSTSADPAQPDAPRKNSERAAPGKEDSAPQTKQADSKPESEPKSNSDSEPKSKSDSDSKPESESESEADSKTGSVSTRLEEEDIVFHIRSSEPVPEVSKGPALSELHNRPWSS